MRETGHSPRFRPTEYLIPVLAALGVLWLIWMAVQAAVRRDRNFNPPRQQLRLEAPPGASSPPARQD